MLTILRRIQTPWATAVFLLVLLAIGYGVVRSSSFQTCAGKHEQYTTYQQLWVSVSALSWLVRNAKVWVKCSGDFIEHNHGPLTAIATILLAIFTFTLWWATRGLLNNAPAIERAYVSGGATFQRAEPRPGQPLGVPVQLVITVNNYGKTPANISHVAAHLWPLGEALPPVPIYDRQLVNMVIPPGREMHPVRSFGMNDAAGNLVYGRFYYTDIFRKPRYSSFILRIDSENTVAIEAPGAYTAWT